MWNVLHLEQKRADIESSVNSFSKPQQQASICKLLEVQLQVPVPTPVMDSQMQVQLQVPVTVWEIQYILRQLHSRCANGTLTTQFPVLFVNILINRQGSQHPLSLLCTD